MQSHGIPALNDDEIECVTYITIYFFRYQSCKVNLSNLSFTFPCIKHHLVQCQRSDALFDAHVHPTANVT